MQKPAHADGISDYMVTVPVITITSLFSAASAKGFSKSLHAKRTEEHKGSCGWRI